MKRSDAILSTLGASIVAIAGGAGVLEPAQAAVAPPKPPAKGPVMVAVVVGDGATVIDFAGPWEIFSGVMLPDRGTTMDEQVPFRLAMVSDKLDTLEAEGGMLLRPRFTYDTVPDQPNIIVMGAQGEHTPAKIAWIKRAAQKADIVMSVCTGAFLLAKTGLLDGLQATTHHDFYDAFEKKFPSVHLVRGPRYVDNGKFATAGGLTSGIELALHVVERYFGPKAAAHTAYYEEYNRSSHRPTA